ncbi:D-alanyl-D-alanine carboxypeptidase family protein [Streptomyces sp. NPDC048111]|uniref:D-alanyl-D-alanine carboxypeptidase family protein n=1 Tax=Streptomyces sp. NPDC048111 TaxID=3365500 RepID=UPI0037109A6D
MVIRSGFRSMATLTATAAIGLCCLAPTPDSSASAPPSGPAPGEQVSLRPGAPALPAEVSALSYVVADARTGNVLAARDAHRKLPPASTLKTLFAVTALPHLRAEDRHTVSEQDLAGIGPGSSLVGVEPGHTYQISDLWRGVFLSSGNDAVHVLASLNGGWDQTAAQMQAKARALGALDTEVVSPDGYDSPGQVSSAFDLAVFGRAGLARPDFAEYCSTASAQFPGGGGSYGIANTNRLLSGNDGVARYPGIVGVKNGYTSNAGNTLIAAAKQGDHTLLVTVMNPQAGGGYAVYEEARTLLDWGFKAWGHVDAVGSLEPVRVKKAVQRPASQHNPAPAAAVGTAAAEDEDTPVWTPAGSAAAGLALAATLFLLLRRRAIRGRATRGRRHPSE